MVAQSPSSLVQAPQANSRVGGIGSQAIFLRPNQTVAMGISEEGGRLGLQQELCSQAMTQ